ncbi:hypothetical protein, partial [Pseudomonas syringae group genomosp. 7]|uniref:hypothetical protein n=1 Tax=Pseudomonas syringae group genomosp. 7 TaxID=251699 RepID=UPI00376FDC18
FFFFFCWFVVLCVFVVLVVFFVVVVVNSGLVVLGLFGSGRVWLVLWGGCLGCWWGLFSAVVRLCWGWLLFLVSVWCFLGWSAGALASNMAL